MNVEVAARRSIVATEPLFLKRYYPLLSHGTGLVFTKGHINLSMTELISSVVMTVTMFCSRIDFVEFPGDSCAISFGRLFLSPTTSS